MPWCNISKTSASVSSGFQTRETFETTRPQAEWFYCFWAFGNLMKHDARWNYFSNKENWFKYHLNNFFQFNYYIWDVKYARFSKKCVWCAWSYHLTIFEYSTTEVTLPSCLSVPSVHVASQSKWQSAADLDLLELAKKRKSVWPALFRGNVCI